MEKSSYTIRRMTRQEVDIAIDWAAAEGWSQGLYDADCFYITDPKGFFIGLPGKGPDLPIPRLFGVTTFELGKA
jgi:hypothetical protein